MSGWLPLVRQGTFEGKWLGDHSQSNWLARQLALLKRAGHVELDNVIQLLLEAFWESVHLFFEMLIQNQRSSGISSICLLGPHNRHVTQPLETRREFYHFPTNFATVQLSWTLPSAHPTLGNLGGCYRAMIVTSSKIAPKSGNRVCAGDWYEVKGRQQRFIVEEGHLPWCYPMARRSRRVFFGMRERSRNGTKIKVNAPTRKHSTCQTVTFRKE